MTLFIIFRGIHFVSVCVKKTILTKQFTKMLKFVIICVGLR